jgi:hypothetical protein
VSDRKPGWYWVRRSVLHLAEIAHWTGSAWRTAYPRAEDPLPQFWWEGGVHDWEFSEIDERRIVREGEK